MLILEAHPFLVDTPPPWGKIKMHKVGRILKPREKLGLFNMNKITGLFQILISVITGNFCIAGSQKIIKS